ncbi:hypothetical protein JL721_1726 [Aureococcus anophagefferens]|nr:hypothetical protein JL721_1726 [Aureococcus anophagefferens]
MGDLEKESSLRDFEAAEDGGCLAPGRFRMSDYLSELVGAQEVTKDEAYDTAVAAAGAAAMEPALVDALAAWAAPSEDPAEPPPTAAVEEASRALAGGLLNYATDLHKLKAKVAKARTKQRENMDHYASKDLLTYEADIITPCSRRVALGAAAAPPESEARARRAPAKPDAEPEAEEEETKEETKTEGA